MAVSVNWGGVLFVGVLIKKQYHIFGVYFTAPDFWKLPNAVSQKFHGLVGSGLHWGFFQEST